MRVKLPLILELFDFRKMKNITHQLKRIDFIKKINMLEVEIMLT